MTVFKLLPLYLTLMTSLFQFSRQFYVAQWYRDCSVESEKLNKQQKKLKNKEEEELENFERNNNLLQENELRKGFLLDQINVKGLGVFAKFK